VYISFFTIGFGASVIVYTISVWILVYEYWKMSWIMPAWLNGITVSQKLKTNLGIGYCVGIGTFVVLMVTYQICYLISHLN